MYVGQLMVASTILEEIKGFEASDCLKLGIQMIEPTLEQVAAAAEKPRPLSFYDWLCLQLAEQYGWICVTNDKALRRQCTANNVPVIWELEMLCLVVEAGGLPAEECKIFIREIQKHNPYFITDLVVETAFRRLDGK